MNAMKYCRVVFAYPNGGTVEIDFGYLTWSQRLASIQALRQQYRECSFRKCFSIERPSWARD